MQNKSYSEGEIYFCTKILFFGRNIFLRDKSYFAGELYFLLDKSYCVEEIYFFNTNLILWKKYIFYETNLFARKSNCPLQGIAGGTFLYITFFEVSNLFSFSPRLKSLLFYKLKFLFQSLFCAVDRYFHRS